MKENPAPWVSFACRSAVSAARPGPAQGSPAETSAGPRGHSGCGRVQLLGGRTGPCFLLLVGQGRPSAPRRCPWSWPRGLSTFKPAPRSTLAFLLSQPGETPLWQGSWSVLNHPFLTQDPGQRGAGATPGVLEVCPSLLADPVTEAHCPFRVLATPGLLGNDCTVTRGPAKAVLALQVWAAVRGPHCEHRADSSCPTPPHLQ